ncbi:MAG: hypothetical protein P1V20_10810 [Verrucomicrobiales bacterium]|nr:hypothetical protein [Verrucomicrobiales bacterium]
MEAVVQGESGTSPLITVSLRHQALFVPINTDESGEAMSPLKETTGLLLANFHKLGFVVTEELRRELNDASPAFHAEALTAIQEVLGVQKNWTPLVKGWDVPTGESIADHLLTWFANQFGGSGTELPCGHVIPENTFPLDRYNGCPFCGTPFEFGEIEFSDQGSSKKVLELWTQPDVDKCLVSLLQSKTALDATQRDSLNLLLGERPLPDVEIAMKETAMLVIASLIENGREDQTMRYIKSPIDVMRFFWFQKTGFAQILEPRTVIKRTAKNFRHRDADLALKHLRNKLDSALKTGPESDVANDAASKAKQALKLKFTRPQCRLAAAWLSQLPQSPEAACELMHPKRRMWVRFIRALRLVEYSNKNGNEKLAAILKAFHQQTYPVTAGELQKAKAVNDSDKAFSLLKQRPGLFSRSLFANMLWFGPEQTITQFIEIVDQVPARLLFSLNSTAETYFEGHNRIVKPLGGNPKVIPPNALLKRYTPPQIAAMKEMIESLCIEAVKSRFAAIPNPAKTIYIDPQLYKIPVAIGERSDTVQDLPAALAGMRFPVSGNTVRLFLQWGEGLPAQHLDMDLSCTIAFNESTEICAYHSLTATGCKHSGDIRSIPEKVGTAEYIDIDLDKLNHAGAKLVTFSCNAYSDGSLSPNLVVGWMNSEHPMKISKRTGVAYDPSCVRHQVRITSGLTKGLAFGVLDPEAREIVWLEMPFGSWNASTLDFESVNRLMAKLDSRLNIGHLLQLKAEAQQLELQESPGSDEDYTTTWAMNTAAVTALLID